MARILVTGASGFIGGHAVRALAARGHDVRASGRRLPAAIHGSRTDASRAVDWMRADLADDALAPLVAGCDAIVHCAALSSPWGTAEAFQRANVVATERLLDAAQRAGVRRFVHLGSPSIYFRFEDQHAVGEGFTPPAHWITHYARSKWESEVRVRAAAAAGMQAIVLRPRAVFGEGDQAILPRLLAIAARGWFPLVHRGRALIDITHVDNVATAIADCIDADVACDGSAYNLTNGQPIRVKDLLVRLFGALRMRVRLVPVPRGAAVALAGLSERIARLRPGQPEPRLTRYGVGVIGWSQTLDIAKARRELGYAPSMSIEEGIVRYARARVRNNGRTDAAA